VPKTPGLEDSDGYIMQFEPEIREVLEQVRRTISHAAHDAKETINYRMPAVGQHGILV
jgi:uncharacterized protein YdhG (YjbR/CyaY superfamily)